MDHLNENQEGNSLHFLDYWRVIRSRKEIILIVMVLVGITGVIVTNLMEKRYKATCLIRVYEDSQNMQVFNNQLMGSSQYNPYFLMTELEILGSEMVLSQVIENLSLTKVWGEEFEMPGPIPKQDALNLLKKRISIQQQRNTSNISITAVSSNPVQAAHIANEIAKVYGQQRIEQSVEQVRVGLSTLDTLMEEENLKVIAAEDRLEEIREELDLTTINYGVRITAESERVRQLQADLMSYRVDMLTRKARLDEIENLEGEGLINSLLMTVPDQSLEMLRSQESDFEIQLSMQLQNLGENHPDVLQMKEGLRRTQQKLEAAILGIKAGLRTDYLVAKSRVEALESELEKVEAAERDAQSRKMLPFERAERKVRVQRSIYASLQARAAQEGVDVALPRMPIKIFEMATPADEKNFYTPNYVLNIALSLFLGGFCGVGLAFFIEYLDTSVKTVDDVERYLNTSVIGVIPQKVKTLNIEGIESPHSESYRVLRTNLQFSRDGKTGGAFAVASGGVGEGKSTTLFNLAFVCAAMGDKVLIVDSDMRRPVQHKIMGMSNRYGLVNVLMRDMPLEDAIKPTEHKNLHFLPSGQLPKHAVGMLDTQRVRDLITNLKARYDFVFFDSPPIMGISDSSILASEVDGVMLVVQYRKYPRQMSARAKHLVENVGGKIAGVVLNNINILRDDYYYYNSYYTHYSETDNESKDLDAAPQTPSQERF
ncbi:polysaccharide biosynthesis tyrosine autokinase [Kiritimatiellaeota bacterium B1221]|nr:polysaccharide biosynthesis tyrosine autokinase [Kiritimatiellaeota bacterium B1221]